MKASRLMSDETRAVYADAYDAGFAAHFETAGLYGLPSEDNDVTREDWLKEFAKIQAGD
jgi:hypothetical protein